MADIITDNQVTLILEGPPLIELHDKSAALKGVSKRVKYINQISFNRGMPWDGDMESVHGFPKDGAGGTVSTVSLWV